VILVLGIGLWWIRWNDTLGGYESRMTLGGRSPGTYYDEVQLFKERGFDRVVFLGEEGRGINYTGNGFADARYLALWIRTHITSIDYYITIPFSYGSGELRDNPANGFENSYWRSWIDGVLGVDDDNRLGFYWSYESCLQGTINDPVPKKKLNLKKEDEIKEYESKYIEFLQEMSDYIHSHGLELIWIPATGTRDATYLKNNSGIPTLAGYFDRVFVQLNYYQYNSQYTFNKLVEKIKWIYEESLSIEMEADCAVLEGKRGHCAECEYANNEPVYCNNAKCLERACDYISGILEAYWELFHRPPLSPETVVNRLFPHRAYYFGTDFKVVDKVRSKCPEW